MKKETKEQSMYQEPVRKEKVKSMKKTETTVVANLQVTVIIPGNATSEKDQNLIITDLCQRLQADDVQLKGIKVFLRDNNEKRKTKKPATSKKIKS